MPPKKAAARPAAKKAAPKNAPTKAPKKAAPKATVAPATPPSSSPTAASAPTSANKSMTDKLIKKGKGVVDPYFTMASTCRVVEDNGKVWQCTLNQTNVGDNNNKFYVIQLLKEEGLPKFYVFTRWGRVGVPGQQATESISNLAGPRALSCASSRPKHRMTSSRRTL